MIRKLHDGDHPAVMRLLTREPELNLFIIGDIENAGYAHERVAHWGEFDAAGRSLTAVLTRYFDSLVFYARAPYDLAGFLTLAGEQEWRYFSAERSMIEPFALRLAHQKRKDTFLARLRRLAWPGGGASVTDIA
jgi:predicted GNAT family acetyltransferase